MRKIDADALKVCLNEKAGDDSIKNPAEFLGYIKGIADAIQAIDSQITIEDERVKNGKWTIVRGLNGKEYRQCSVCLNNQELTSQMNYCPICGSSMYGGFDETV